MEIIPGVTVTGSVYPAKRMISSHNAALDARLELRGVLAARAPAGVGHLGERRGEQQPLVRLRQLALELLAKDDPSTLIEVAGTRHGIHATYEGRSREE